MSQKSESNFHLHPNSTLGRSSMFWILRFRLFWLLWEELTASSVSTLKDKTKENPPYQRQGWKELAPWEERAAVAWSGAGGVIWTPGENEEAWGRSRFSEWRRPALYTHTATQDTQSGARRPSWHGGTRPWSPNWASTLNTQTSLEGAWGYPKQSAMTRQLARQHLRVIPHAENEPSTLAVFLPSLFPQQPVPGEMCQWETVAWQKVS